MPPVRDPRRSPGRRRSCRPGGVLEPEPPGGPGVVDGRLLGGLLLGLLGGVPVERLLVGLDLLVALDLHLAERDLLDLLHPVAVAAAGTPTEPRTRARSGCPRGRPPGAPTGPCRRRGAAPPRTGAARARASASAWRQPSDGSSRPASSSARAASRAARRAVPGASAASASSPLRTNGSPRSVRRASGPRRKPARARPGKWSQPCEAFVLRESGGNRCYAVELGRRLSEESARLASPPRVQRAAAAGSIPGTSASPTITPQERRFGPSRL